MPTRKKRTHATRQRAAIGAVLEAAQGPLAAEEVWELARKEHEGLGLRTVFRNLQEQVEEGALLKVNFPGHPPRYERPSARHHPHFVCLACERVFDLPGETPEVRPLCELPAGFVAEGAEVTFFGRCDGCSARRRARPAGKRGRVGKA